MIRLGLCCIFWEQPIKFVTTTATVIGRMKRSDALEKLSRLCLANADSLLASLQYCAAQGIGCFRITSQILPRKTHPQHGYDLMNCRTVPRLFVGSKSAESLPALMAFGLAFIPTSSSC